MPFKEDEDDKQLLKTKESDNYKNAIEMEKKVFEDVHKYYEKIQNIHLNEFHTTDTYQWAKLFNKAHSRPQTTTSTRLKLSSEDTTKSAKPKKEEIFRFPIALIDEEYSKIKDFIEIPKYQDFRRQMANTYSNFLNPFKEKNSRCKSANRVVDLRPPRYNYPYHITNFNFFTTGLKK